eukprot:jgi/Botrbrau1/19117/Bobra.0077s0030.1
MHQRAYRMQLCTSPAFPLVTEVHRSSSRSPASALMASLARRCRPDASCLKSVLRRSVSVLLWGKVT